MYIILYDNNIVCLTENLLIYIYIFEFTCYTFFFDIINKILG